MEARMADDNVSVIEGSIIFSEIYSELTASESEVLFYEEDVFMF